MGFVSRFQRYQKAFGTLGAIRHISIDSVAGMGGGNIIYSQTGEDLILATILEKYVGSPWTSVGKYVDVGCNHPIKCSNTFFFYKLGWSGVVVDANRDLVERFGAIRSLDKGVSSLVSNESAVKLFTKFEDPLVSSVDEAHVSQWADRMGVLETVEMVSRTLTDILESSGCPRDFELLSVDVEGHDFEVLQSLDFTKFHPKVVVIELHEFDILKPQDSKIYQLMYDNGYQLVGYVVWNGYFVRNES